MTSRRDATAMRGIMFGFAFELGFIAATVVGLILAG